MHESPLDLTAVAWSRQKEMVRVFGVAPTGRHVWWYGTPIFTFEGDLIRDLWVLGDIACGLVAGNGEHWISSPMR